jgi:DNA ligase (NAD+)
LALGLLAVSGAAGAVGPSDAAQAEQRMVELRAEIAHNDELYFKQAAPEITDYAYDQLKRELRRLERLYPEFAGGEEARVGDDRSGDFPGVRHEVPMLSLNKSYEEGELAAYCRRVEQQLGRTDLTWVLEPKFDGLAISVVYEHGRFCRASTRGDGHEGDDVTANVRAIRGLPMRLRAGSGEAQAIPALVELRGEVYLAYADFNRINVEREEAGLEPYAHPRNLAAGTLKQDDPAEVAHRHLSIVFYGWGAWEPAASQPASQLELHRKVAAWGLPGVKDLREVHRFAEVWAGVREFQQLRARWPFPVDGAVLKLNDVALQRKLGDGPAAPNWAIAYKYPPEQAASRLRAVVWQVGRTGVLTPVAVFDPVTIGGTTITRASLFNREHIRRLGLRIGDWVEIEKAGEVVPQIAAVDASKRPPDAAPYGLPERCPECQTRLIEAGAQLRCPNADCPAQVRRRLVHFTSEGGVAITGLGPTLVDALVGAGLAKTPADLYRLDRARLAPVLQGKAADNLLAAIGRSRRAPLWRYVAGLGIPRVGPASARILARRFPTLAELAAVRREDLLTAEDQPVLAGLGRSTTLAVWAYFAEDEHRRMVAELGAAGVQPAAASAAKSGPLAGKVFVLTGTLPGLTREEATRLILAGGGEVHASVSGATDYLVAGENPGNKLDEAKRRGVRAISEAQLRRLLAADD